MIFFLFVSGKNRFDVPGKQYHSSMVEIKDLRGIREKDQGIEQL